MVFKTNLSIVKLDLSGNSIGASGMKHLARMFEENSTINDLVCIDAYGMFCRLLG